LLGAVIGLSLGFAAKSLIKRIDSESRKFSSRIVVVTFVIGAVVSDLIFLRFSEIELRLSFAILCFGLLVQSLVDFFTHRLVRQISHGMAVSGALLLGLHSINVSNFDALVSAGVCAAFGVAVSIFSNKISSGSLGAGDVRLIRSSWLAPWLLELFDGYLGVVQCLFACRFIWRGDDRVASRVMAAENRIWSISLARLARGNFC